MKKMYGEYAVRFMIADGIYKYICKMNFDMAKFPELSKIVEEVIRSFND